MNISLTKFDLICRGRHNGEMKSFLCSRQTLISWIFALAQFLFLGNSGAQTKAYINDLDDSLTLKSLVVLPLVDNVGSVYAGPATSSLIENLDSFHQWDIQTLQGLTKIPAPEELETKPNLVQSLMKSQKADGIITGRIAKGPKGIYIKLGLYVGQSGLPVGFESLNNYEGFETNDIKIKVRELAIKLISKLPYQARVLSRRDQLITLSLGSRAGIRQGLELTVNQIVKINRHPKFNFIVSTENLTLGKVRIEKVEDSLSFASIITERTEGVITPGSKLSWDHFVEYPSLAQSAEGQLLPALSNSPDAPVSLGDHPKEWQPENPPTFGKVGLLFGLGSVGINNSLTTTSASGSSSVAPSFHVNGEMWFTPEWFANAKLDAWVFSINNGLSGSTPNTLNVTAEELALNFGYNFLFNNDFFGPKFTLSAGFASINTSVGGSSPTAFESSTYSGLNLGLGGEFPIAIESWRFPLLIGGRLFYFLSPSQSETPTTSGAGSSSQMASFALTFNHRISERTNVRTELEFDSMSSSFTGTGTRSPVGTSSSETLTTLMAGVEFMF